MRISFLLKDLLASERTGGVLLVLCTACSLVLTNSTFGSAYQYFWHTDLGGRPLEFWVNDGLMTVFFLMVGLELEREVYIGELANRRQALLPVLAALGGMLVPALIHWCFNKGTPAAAGAGIPMATDIAFAIGILSLLGDRVPLSLKVFLTALAVIDDLGAILVIALFYSGGLQGAFLAGALALWGLAFLLNRRRVCVFWPYALVGIAMWYCMLRSGVHPTITGVVMAFAIPFGGGGEGTLSFRLQHALHRPVAFVIMPLFALANTCIVLSPGWMQDLLAPASLGIILGLLLGKPLGIVGFSALAVRLRWADLPTGTRWTHVSGVGLLGGIGFTMSIFIALLAFSDTAAIQHAKTAVLAGSCLAALLGSLWLFFTLPKPRSARAEGHAE